MKKILSLFLSVVMLLSAIITVNAASFKDVKSSDWYYSSVNYVADKGIMNGTSSTKFSPKASLTRAMGVTLLYRVAGSPSVSGVTIPFTDVKGGQWYTDAVKWAYKNGIVTGKSATYFHTNGNITRAEFATILYRYSDSQKYTLVVTRTDVPSDASKIPTWALGAINVMYKAEIINGHSDGSFDSNAKITRAEAAAMIERFMKAPKEATNNNIYTDSEPVPTTGKLVIKEKKYNYQGANVMLLNVENQTSKNLNISIDATFYDANGKIVMKQNRYVEGFPANYRNYVVFQPGIKFDSFKYEVTTKTHTGPAYMQYISCGNNVELTFRPSIYDEPFSDREPRAEMWVTYDVLCSYTEYIYYWANFILFDKNGEIFWISDNWGCMLGQYPDFDDGKRPAICTYDGIKYKDYTIPEELNGDCTGIVVLTDVSDTIKY